MNRSTRYSPEIRERAVRMVFEHQAEYDSQWSAMNSIAGKIGCTAETLRKPGWTDLYRSAIGVTQMSSPVRNPRVVPGLLPT